MSKHIKINGRTYSLKLEHDSFGTRHITVFDAELNIVSTWSEDEGSWSPLTHKQLKTRIGVGQ